MNAKSLERVLHVDDEADIREVAKLALEAVGGLTVLSCASADDAVGKAQAFRPDVILLDVMMPGTDGPATLKVLRGLDGLGDVPAIFMTAKAGADEQAALVAHGAIGVVAKPFDPMKLADEVRAIVLRVG